MEAELTKLKGQLELTEMKLATALEEKEELATGYRESQESLKAELKAKCDEIVTLDR